MRESCEGDECTAIPKAIAWKGSIQLFERCWVDVTWSMVVASDLVKGEPGVDADVEGPIEAGISTNAPKFSVTSATRGPLFSSCSED